MASAVFFRRGGNLFTNARGYDKISAIPMVKKEFV